MKKKRGVLMVILIAIQLVQSAGQISGIVTDVNGEPIFGASVALESSSSGTATDLDGRFAIGSELINSDKLKLLISSVGYNTVE
ncbi:MAG: hypothetical protein ACI9FN_003255, partial [Saprospiraceae bacterium]